MAQLKDLIVAGSARLLGKTYFEDTVTINDTLEVDAIKADSVITPSLNSDGTALTVGGNISLTAPGKYITVGDGVESTSTSNGVLRVVGGLNASKASYFDAAVKIKGAITGQSTLNITGAITGQSTLNITGAITGGNTLTVSGVAQTGNTLTVKNSSGGDSTLIFDRGSSANWKIKDSSATLYFQTDWDGAKTDYYTILSLSHTSGNANLKGRLTTAGVTSSLDISPSTSAGSGMTLGTTSKYWRRLYVGDGTAGGVSDGAVMVSGGIRTTSNIALVGDNEDLSINFIHSPTSETGYDWRIRYVGTGSGDGNYLNFESNQTDGVYTPALRLGLTTLDAAFGGHIYPITAFGKNVGSTSNPWANVYAKSYYIYNANKSNAGGLYVQTDGTTSQQGESYVVAGNPTASGKAGNSRGSIFLYSSSTGYTRLIPGTNNDSNYTLYLPGATGQLVYHTNDASVGSVTAPVYVDGGGKITECNMAQPGDWWNALPVIGSSGVMEIGKYIDFHISDTATNDYDYRIEALSGTLKGSGAFEAATSIKAGTSITAGTTMTVGTNLTVKGTTTLGDAEGDTVSIVGDTTFSNDVSITKTLTVKGNTTLGDATSDTTTIQGTINLTGNGALATGSTATALSGMTGNIKVLNGGIVTNKDVAADNFYVKDKVRIKYDSTNDYLYFVFN